MKEQDVKLVPLSAFELNFMLKTAICDHRHHLKRYSVRLMRV
jgi:hypothetical protein